MVMNSVVSIIIGVIILITLGLLIAMGIVVYKDAEAHDMKGILWAALAVFAPNFIGLIVYLVVRSNQEKKYQCSNCQAEIQKDYNICPNCQAVFGQICSTCKHAITSQTKYCPYCGGEVSMDETAQTAHKLTNKTNIVKPLAIIGGIFITMMVIIILAMVSMFSVGISSSESYKSQNDVSIMCVENDTGNTRKASFKYKDGGASIKLKKEIGETITLDTQISLTEGTIELTLLDPDGNSLYNHIYEGEVLPETLTFPAASAGTHVLKLEVNKASGSYEIKAN